MEETGSQPIPPQLTGNIGEQATPTDPGNMQKCTQNHIVSVEYASHMMVPSASRIKISWTISKNHTNETIRVQSGKRMQSKRVAHSVKNT